MSQAATLYRISNNEFIELEKLDNKNHFDFNAHSKDATTFEGSFMALEYVLSKGQENMVLELIRQIFTPIKSFGGFDFSGAITDEEIDFILKNSDTLIPYLDTNTISKLNGILDKVSETDINLRYSSKELNENGIYPRVWHDDDSKGFVYNKRQILEDLVKLKSIFSRASKENDYILVLIE